MGLAVPVELCVTAGYFKEKSALGKNNQKRSKMAPWGFFNDFKTFCY